MTTSPSIFVTTLISGSLPAGDSACAGITPYTSQCEALENANADGNRYRTISAVSFAVAGAAACRRAPCIGIGSAASYELTP